MNKNFLLLLFCCIFLESPAQKSTNIILSSKALQTASVAYYALDAQTGEVLTGSVQKSLVPASVMKIVTTAAALEILGPQFRFKTLFGYSGLIDNDSGILKGDLVIKGGCDPAFYSRYFTDYYKGTFEDWAEKMKKTGVQRITGDLLIDISAMQDSSIPGGWIWDDIGNYYGTGVSAVSYFDNLYEIHFSSPPGEGKSAKINYTYPVIEDLKLENKVLTSSINKDLSRVYGAPNSLFQKITGTVPMNRNDFVVKAANPDPAVTAAADFKKVLSSKGILLEGQIKKVSRPKQFVLVSEKFSPELGQLLVPLNQKSLNLFAEQLLREIGRAQKNDPSLQTSLEALTEFWHDKNINLEGFYATDGSGLSRTTDLCPRTLVEILAYMYKGINNDVFFNSLPLAGVNGTLDHSFRGTPLENNLRAKTGSMNRVRSLAGILTSHKGKKVVFALIINNYEEPRIDKIFEKFVINLFNNQ